MVEVTIFRHEDSFKGVQVFGHADSVAEGADLVCCAVSVLTLNLINSLEQLTEDKTEVLEDQEHGLVQCLFAGTPGGKADLLLRSFVIGVRSIEEQYGDWLKVKTRKV